MSTEPSITVTRASADGFHDDEIVCVYRDGIAYSPFVFYLPDEEMPLAMGKPAPTQGRFQ